jgi:hypothetical protein
MNDVSTRLGNALFWICIVASVGFVAELWLMDANFDYETIFFGWSRMNGKTAFLLQAFLVVATYGIGVAARYVLTGNTHWKPWRRDTYR